MGLGVAEIRDRAERFRAAVEEELLEARAGRKSWPELSPLYESQRILAFHEVSPVIERELAGAEGEDERRLRRLLAWAARHAVLRACAPLDDEHAHWESTATVEVEGVDLPLSQVDAAVESAADRGARARLARARALKREEALELQLDRLNRWHAAAEDLGYGDALQATERLAGVSLRGLKTEADRILAETGDVYETLRREHLARYVGVDPDEAERHDAERLGRLEWLDDHLEGGLLDRVRGDLAEMGLPLERDGRVEVQLEPFPGPGMRAWCAPIRVPKRVVLFVTPTGTYPHTTSLLCELGRAVHYAHTDPALPFEYRCLGDEAVVEGHAALFEGLSRCRPWTARALELSGERREQYVRLVHWLDLFRLRERAARLQFELELAESGRPQELGERWAELFRAATGFRTDPRMYLCCLGQRFGVAVELRGRMLAAQLRRELRERYDEDWFRNPRTGPTLGGWLEDGLRWSAAERAARLGGDRLGADALLAELRERLP